jgi:hypothetical protein
MIETPQQYITRILGYKEGKNALKIMATTPTRLAKLLKNVPTAKLKKRPEPKKWAVSEILAHLADGEMVLGVRMRFVLGQNGVSILATDQDTWSDLLEYRSIDPKESLWMFTALRGWNLQMLKRAPKKLWNNVGMHSERGEESVTKMVELYAGHDINHFKQIEAIVRNGKGRTKKDGHTIPG